MTHLAVAVVAFVIGVIAGVMAHRRHLAGVDPEGSRIWIKRRCRLAARRLSAFFVEQKNFEALTKYHKGEQARAVALRMELGLQLAIEDVFGVRDRSQS